MSPLHRPRLECRLLCPAGWIITTAVCLGLSVMGCDTASTSTVSDADASPAPIQVFAASSTTDALRILAAEYQQVHGVPVELVFESTSTLANQIMNGAPADIFLSASEDWAEQVSRHFSHAPPARVDLLSNQLVIIAATDSPLQLTDPADLSRPEFTRIAIADPDAVPAGIYAKQALQALHLWDALQTKLIPGDNVRAALQYVDAGTVPVGIVYASDVVANSRVRVLCRFDTHLHEPVVYPLLLLRPTAANVESARPFYEFLQSAAAAEVFRRQGFQVVTPPAMITRDE